MPDIFCFADAGARVGSGHIFRVYPVLQALLRGGNPACLLTPVSRSGLRKMQLESSLPASAKEFSKMVAERSPCAVVVDSYRQREILLAAAGTTPTVLFDDHYAPPPEISVIVNASPSATRERYGAFRKVLLGPKYASLHSAFAKARRRFQIRGTIQRILVALGGNDTAGELPSVARAVLKGFPSAELMVCGAPGADVQKHPRIARREWLSQEEVAELMASSDLAILAAGQMLVQAACIGLPAIALPQTSNQSLHAASWEALGSAIVAKKAAGLAETAPQLSRANRTRMSESGRKVVDGKGAARIARQLMRLAEGCH